MVKLTLKLSQKPIYNQLFIVVMSIIIPLLLINLVSAISFIECYQESANVSTSCGGLSTGLYLTIGTWDVSQIAQKTYDSDWETHGDGNTGTSGTLYINYTVPSGSVNSSKWETKLGTAAAGFANRTINSTCWSTTKLQFKIISELTTGSSNASCFNGSKWLTIYYNEDGGNNYQIWEEAMIWNMTNASNIAIELINPSKDSVLSLSSINFTTYYNITGTNDNNYTWKNTTYYVWYSNGTLFNQTFKTLSGNNTRNTTLINNFTIGGYKWNVHAFYGNDTFTNNTWADNNTFIVGASLISTNYNSSAYETSRQNFIAEFNILNNSEISLVQLIYNGTNYTVSEISQVGNNLTISKMINIPVNLNNFSSQINDFYFRFTYAGNSVQNSDTFQQNISYINLQICNGTFYDTSLNFTLFDERNLTKISPATNPISFASTFRYWLGDGSVYKNYSYKVINSSSATANNFTFCISPYLPNNYTFKTDLDSIFSAQDYTENEYYLRNATLTNNTATFSLYLYLLSSAEATKFYVTIKQGITFIDSALVNTAKYFIGEGSYKTTSIKLTDNDGKFPAYLDLDNKYLFSIVKNGQVLGIVEKTASCSAAPCLLEINLDESIAGAFRDYDNAYAGNIYSNITFNPTTKMVEYVFVDTTGLANYFRLVVKKLSYNGTIGATICDSFSYSSAGILNCNVTGYTGDFSAVGYISRSPEKIDKVMGFFISDALTILGLLGIFLNIAIIITVVLTTAATTRGNPSAIIFMLGITILLLKIGGIFPFSWVVVVPIELAIVWALMKVKT